MNIYKILDTNELFRETFRQPKYPPMPEEVLGWNDSLQELFCILSIAHIGVGMTVEEADEKAIQQVKESEWFVRRSTRINGNQSRPSSHGRCSLWGSINRLACLRRNQKEN